MFSRRVLVLVAISSAAVSCFMLGVMHARRSDAAIRATYDARIDAVRDELRRQLEDDRSKAVPAGTTGQDLHQSNQAASDATRAQLMADIKEELQNEMGLLPLRLLRDRRSSFVELYAEDNAGKTNYGTAGYLGGGYFVTVKHGVVALKGEDASESREIVSIKVVYNGKKIPARLVDAGAAKMEVDSGDWAIIKTRNLDLPPLRVDTSFAYEFADPIFRFGNDYSKGIVVSSGYIGQKTAAGLVTCLTDGHPGASGGGVLDRRGNLVGIPIGRMQGDFRFSFILPMRAEMFRQVPSYLTAERAVAELGANAPSPTSGQ
jgi:S1-C subfamily serine protease